MCAILQKYERRSCRVKEWEQSIWEDIIPSMMSDEEDMGNNTFCLHHQEWRSQELSDFLKKLDKRADEATRKIHPCRNRVVGTPLKVTPPSITKDWMVNKEDSPPLFY